jgi:hypothetical protein
MDHIRIPQTENQPAPKRQEVNSMNKTKRWIAVCGFVLCGALPESSTCGQPSVSVAVSVPSPSVEIRAESDFYEPLTPHGEWVVVGSYGRCWRPARVEASWRPYCNGHWQRTEAGWYWVSDEPWAWATYHYGRWDFTDEYGWYWVPQTQWAPAWVSWHSGGGYVGWAPLQPSVSISIHGFVGFNQSRISQRAFVFVEERRFLEPIGPKTVIVNNATIINKTTVITDARIVNNTVINEGPAISVIEKASGRKVEAVPARELRQKHEVAIASKPPVATQEKKNSPAKSEAESRSKKPEPAPTQIEKPDATRELPVQTPKKHAVQVDNEKLAPPTLEARPKGNPHANPNAAKEQEKPSVKESNESNRDNDKEHGKKPKD